MASKKITISIQPKLHNELKPILQNKGAKLSSVIQVLLSSYIKKAGVENATN